jgi:GT2 family glycosyltransferase
MKPDNTFAILIPTRNRPKILQRTLEELQSRGFGGHPLIVYDDASDDPDQTAKVISHWGKAYLIWGKVRGGQTKGRNILINECPYEYALFLDDDSWPENYAAVIEANLSMASSHLSIATFQYKSLADGRLSVPEGTPRRQVTSFLGGASMIKLADLRRVGGYREFFTYGYEEPELALRLWLSGARIEYFPDVVVTHNQFYTAEERRDSKEYDYLYARNAILMSSLNFPFFFGLPHGLLRSLRRSLLKRRNGWAKLRGTASGLYMTFRGSGIRQPCTWKQTWAWLAFCRRYQL